MTVKQTTSHTDEAHAYAHSLVEAGEFSSVNAAASVALIALKRARDAEERLLESEVIRRAKFPPDQWVERSPSALAASAAAR